MKTCPTTRCFQTACLVALLALVHVSSAQAQGTPDPDATPIQESEIVSLRNELTEQKKATSSSSKRRACKSTVRKGAALIKASPSAPNRFRVLAIMLQSQKRLLVLDNSARNRDALYDICSQLAQAPDADAAIRLEADLLLSDKELTLKDADVKERALALAALIQRYRDTPGEAKSLMLAALIAPKLEAFELEKEIINAMEQRFAADPSVIGWRRENLAISQLDVLFAGNYTRNDGVSLSFPIDRMGHTYLIYFWSKESPGFEAHMATVKALQARCPDQIEVYSFNLDQLPDGGESIIRTMGLDWTVMHLPGGRRSQTYRAYATKDPFALRVNAHGHAFVHPALISALVEEMPLEQDLDDARYLAQLQSLFIGDFLVTDGGSKSTRSRTAESVPAAKLDAIQVCFSVAPIRYRQTREQTLANYKKAEVLCSDAIAHYPKAPDLWLVRNRRIIALLGMWNLDAEPKHLQTAVEEARVVLAATPAGAEIVPQFCLAKVALRQDASDPQSVLSALISAAGGTEAPAAAYAAAAILAMDANARELHSDYREMLLKTITDDSTIRPVVSFLRDQNHTFRLFQANYYHPPSKARRVVRAALRRNAAALDSVANTNRRLKAELNTLTGGKLRIPHDTAGKLTFVIFVEPPAEEEHAAMQNDVMQMATELADTHLRKGIDVIAAFLSDDTDTIRTLVKKNAWKCQVAIVPDGLGNPLVQQLGILSADRLPNMALLRADGTIVWTISGLVHPQLKSEGVNELKHAIHLGMRANIDVVEMENSLKALKKGELEEAVQLFLGPFPQPKKPHPDGWTAPRHYGRALAHMRLNNWDAALADIDAAINTHQIVFGYGKPCACQTVADLRLTRATILEQLKQPQEAEVARQRASAATSSHSTSRYGVFHDKLEELNIKQ